MKKTLLTLVGFLAALVLHAQCAPNPQAHPSTAASPAKRNPALFPARTRPPLPRFPNGATPPQILGYSPAFGLPGTVLTIYGTSFGSLQSGSYVYALSGPYLQTSTTWPVTSW